MSVERRHTAGSQARTDAVMKGRGVLRTTHTHSPARSTRLSKPASHLQSWILANGIMTGVFSFLLSLGSTTFHSVWIPHKIPPDVINVSGYQSTPQPMMHKLAQVLNPPNKMSNPEHTNENSRSYWINLRSPVTSHILPTARHSPSGQLVFSSCTGGGFLMASAFQSTHSF